MSSPTTKLDNRKGVSLKTYVVVRQASNSNEPTAYYVDARNKTAIQEWISDWDTDDVSITYTTLVIKRIKED
jgi:hypothetical protein